MLQGVVMQSQAIMATFNTDSPRYQCCGHHVELYAKVIVVAEIVFAVIVLFAVIITAATLVQLAPIGMLVGGIINTLVLIVVSALVILGIRRQSSTLLTPYLVVKGFQIGCVGIGLIFGLLGLVGLSTVIGMITAEMHKKGYVDKPSGQHAIMGVTAFFAILTLSMACAMGFLVWFFVTIFKCHRYLRERAYYASEETNAVTYTPCPGAQIIIQFTPPSESDGLPPYDNDSKNACD